MINVYELFPQGTKLTKNQIRAVRQYFGYKTEELADVFSISRKRMYDYENGNYKRETTKIKIIDRFYLTEFRKMLEELVNGTN